MTSEPANSTKDDVILVYARIRPPAHRKIHRNGTGKYEILENEEAEKNSNNNIDFLHLNVPKDDRIGGYVDNSIDKYQFSFHKVFSMNSKQNEIFSTMAIPIINNTINGYNGTIFAYGQTGSGKTYTMTGGTKSYDERGLIPRSISYIFNKCKEKKEYKHKIQISYLEIYNNEGYDLLNEDEENNKLLTDLPKVKLFEDENGIISLSNINLINISNEEEALNYLFIGDTNRMICETPNNDTSSRSHCIFTIFIESQKIGSDCITRCKLNLVDLAGSERVYKSGLHGNILTESKYINLSLHFLEQVIIALHSKQKHIPYRNSMITTILKDSLGGNCKTVMISTLSMDLKSIFETSSTCRFSQRVALIKNITSINQQIDPNLLIKRLKLQIKELKQELFIVKELQNKQELGELNQEEKERCKQMIEYFVQNNDDEYNDDDNVLFNISDPRKIKHCFKCIKHIIIYQPKQKQQIVNINNTNNNNANNKIKELHQTVQERDQEINILVKMLKKNKQTINKKKFCKKKLNKNNLEQKEKEKEIQSEEISVVAKAGSLNNEDALQRNNAFKIFVKQSNLYTIVEENKNILKRKFDEAKNLGILVNSTRNKMNEIKSKIEQLQIARAMNKMNVTQHNCDNGNDDDDDHVSIMDEDVNMLKYEIEKEKEIYRKYYLSLKNIKVEIDHIKCMLKKNRRQIQLDFENYWKQIQNNKHLKKIKEKKNKIKIITGDKVADENIAAFYKMRDEILKSMK